MEAQQRLRAGGEKEVDAPLARGDGLRGEMAAYHPVNRLRFKVEMRPRTSLPSLAPQLPPNCRLSRNPLDRSLVVGIPQHDLALKMSKRLKLNGGRV